MARGIIEPLNMKFEAAVNKILKPTDPKPGELKKQRTITNSGNVQRNTRVGKAKLRNQRKDMLDRTL